MCLHACVELKLRVIFDASLPYHLRDCLSDELTNKKSSFLSHFVWSLPVCLLSTGLQLATIHTKHPHWGFGFSPYGGTANVLTKPSPQPRASLESESVSFNVL